VAKGGYSLQDHLADPTTLAKIEERTWHSIVLQENTSVAAQMLPETIEAMERIATMVKQKGTKMYLFMTWPYRDEPDMLVAIRKTYESGKLATGATLVSVGQEWQSIDQNQEVVLSMYDADGVHPSLAGSFYTAAMFFKAIYGKSPADNSYTAGLSIEVANYLKAKVD